MIPNSQPTMKEMEVMQEKNMELQKQRKNENNEEKESLGTELPSQIKMVPLNEKRNNQKELETNDNAKIVPDRYLEKHKDVDKNEELKEFNSKLNLIIREIELKSKKLQNLNKVQLYRI